MMESRFTAVGEDVLYTACKNGNKRTVQSLLQAGLPEQVVNYTDQSGLTSLMVASISGRDEIISILLKAPPVDLNMGDNEGNTPLMFAAEAGHVATVETLLLSRDVDIDIQNQNGFTALMKAAVQGRLECIHVLLEAGASNSIKDFGRSFCAYEWAKYCGRKQCAKKIIEISKKLPKTENGRRMPERTKSFSEPDLSKTTNNRKITFSRLGTIVVNLFKLRDKRLIADLDKSPLAFAAKCASSPVLPELYTNHNSPVFRKKFAKSQAVPEIKVTPYISRSDSVRRSSSKRRKQQKQNV